MRVEVAVVMVIVSLLMFHIFQLSWMSVKSGFGLKNEKRSVLQVYDAGEYSEEWRFERGGTIGLPYMTMHKLIYIVVLRITS